MRSKRTTVESTTAYLQSFVESHIRVYLVSSRVFLRHNPGAKLQPQKGQVPNCDPRKGRSTTSATSDSELSWTHASISLWLVSRSLWVQHVCALQRGESVRVPDDIDLSNIPFGQSDSGKIREITLRHSRGQRMNRILLPLQPCGYSSRGGL